MKKRIILFIFLALFVIEAFYFNIALDFLLVLLLFLTAYSIGTLFKITVKFIDSVFIRLALGLGVIGFLVWLTTFNNFSYKSLYLIISLSIILFRIKYWWNDLKILKNQVILINRKNKALFPILYVFFLFYIIPASYPIFAADSMAYHIALPLKILLHTHYDYNVIEQVGFGNYAILPQMFYLYLMALGGGKALALFAMFISFLILLMILRIGSKIENNSLFINLIVLVYLSTPLIYHLSTTLYVDVFAVYFVLSAVVGLIYLKNKLILRNALIYSFLLGTAMFAKQQAAFFVVPLAFLLIFLVIQSLIRKEINLANSLKISSLSILLFCLPFVPIIIIIWYKTGNPLFPFMNEYFQSPYFDTTKFIDPFDSNPLSLSPQSIFSIVFNTSKNMEIDNGALGYYLLFILGLPLTFIFNRKKESFFIFLLFIISYQLSIFLSSNLRYMLGSLVLAILPSCLVIYFIFKYIKFDILKTVLVYLAALILIAPNIKYLFSTDKSFMFREEMLIPDSRLCMADNQSVLDYINRKGVYVLSNNDWLRGDFKGYFYTLDWFNQYLLTKMEKGEFSPIELLSCFDYYLVSKNFPLNYEQYFSLSNQRIRDTLQLVRESKTHYLYKVKPASSTDTTFIIGEVFEKPIKVKPTENKAVRIESNFDAFRIMIEAEKIDVEENVEGRFQINWYDKNSNPISFTITPFMLEDVRKIYVSEIIRGRPPEAAYGFLYLTSHRETPILVHSFKLYGVRDKQIKNLLQYELMEYGKKWPHLAQ
ncbi:MAG: hypothetical protein N2319_04525 [Candidatus Kapabacteria bacterium]|nr:hypothetical protein [Candidatus Kapabacteria bacterium]